MESNHMDIGALLIDNGQISSVQTTGDETNTLNHFQMTKTVGKLSPLKLYWREMKNMLPNIDLNEWVEIHQEKSSLINTDYSKYDLDFVLEIIIYIRNITLCQLVPFATILQNDYKEKFFKELEQSLDVDNLEAIDSLANSIHDKTLNRILRSLQENDNLNFPKQTLQNIVKPFKETVSTAKRLHAHYIKLMTNMFSKSGCFAKKEFNDVSKEAELTVLKGSPKTTLSLTKRMLALQNNRFWVQNENFQKQTWEGVKEVSEIFYRKTMEGLLQKNIRRPKDIEEYHKEICKMCHNVITMNVRERIALDDNTLKKHLENILDYYLITNLAQMDTAIAEINSTMQRLECHFYNEMQIKIRENVLTDNEFKIMLMKLQPTVVDELRQKIKQLCPEEIDSRFIKMLENKIAISIAELRKKNRMKNDDEENRGCEMPVIVMEFGLQYTQFVTFNEIENSSGVNPFCHAKFDEKNKVLNRVSFFNDVPHVGKNITQSDSSYTIDDILKKHINESEPKTNFLYYSALIFKYVKEKCDQDGNCCHATAVISIPIWFTSQLRQNLKDATIIAGFNQVFLINNTTAAALYDSKSKSIEQNVFLSDHNKLTIVVLPEDNYCHSAVYRMEKETLKMVFNFQSKKSKIYGSALSNVFDYYKKENITNSILICADNNFKKIQKYENILKEKVGTYYRTTEDQVLKGTLLFAQAMAKKIVAAKESIIDLTFYKLMVSYNDEKPILAINQGIPSNRSNGNEYPVLWDSPSQKYNESVSITMAEETIFGKILVQDLCIKRSCNAPVKILSSVNNENIYEVNSVLDTKNHREFKLKTIANYKEEISKIQKYKISEEKKSKLKSMIENVDDNLEKVNQVFIEDIVSEIKKARKAIQSPHISDDSIDKFLEYFEHVKISE